MDLYGSHRNGKEKMCLKTEHFLYVFKKLLRPFFYIYIPIELSRSYFFGSSYLRIA